MRFALINAVALCAIFGSTAIASDYCKLKRGELEVVGDANDQVLLLNEKELVKCQGFNLSIERTFSLNNKEIALIMENSGGTGCPAEFFLVCLDSKGKANVTPRFGTCSDLFKAQIKDGKLVINIPKMRQKGKSVYTFDGEVLTEDGAVIK